jgi:hypothetical protein
MADITPSMSGWVYNPLNLHVADSDNRFVCDVEGGILHGREEQIGLLIAAAPELLETCRACLTGFEELRSYLKKCALTLPEGLPAEFREPLSIEERLQDVIASATTHR